MYKLKILWIINIKKSYYMYRNLYVSKDFAFINGLGSEIGWLLYVLSQLL